MEHYEIYAEAERDDEILVKNYNDLLANLITRCLSEVNKDVKGNNISESIDGGTS